MHHLHPSRRNFIKWTSGTLAALTLPACAEDEEVKYRPGSYTLPTSTPNGEEPRPEEMMPVEMEGISEEEITAWEEAGVLTANEPGDWADKIVGHYPMVKKSGDRVMVMVPHAMDEEHYIEAIYLKNYNGELVASKRLSASDDYATAEFTISDDSDLTAYSVCNLHQVWSAPVVRTLFQPGPWADKVIGHTPKVMIEGDQAIVNVPHPMTEEHYIVGLYITDQDGSVIGKTQLSPSDMASYSFTIPEGTEEVQPWALCDDHDLWIGQSVALADAEYVYDYESTGVLNADEPGQWGDKIAGHYPLVSMNENMITVNVAHPMDTDHYIEAIYLKDTDGNLLGFKKLSPSDQATAQFMVVDPDAEYYAYAMCNLHEVWAAPIMRSGDRPGPWADKVNSHTPSVEVGPGTATVTVQHPMDDDHYIAALYLTNANGAVIAKKQLNPQEYQEAQYTFELPSGVTTVTPWALCDDHDLWSGPTVNV